MHPPADVARGLAIASSDALFDLRPLFLITKPLTTLLLLVLATRRGGPRGVRRAILAGLALSLTGDIALMFELGFVAGLAAFLCAHLLYLHGFTREARLAERVWPFAVYAAIGGGFVTYLWPDLPAGLRMPVLLYVVALAAMAAQAAVRWRVLDDGRAGLAALGGLAFVASDAMLAIDRFHAPWPTASAFVLASYWTAQALIVAVLPRR